MSMQEVLESIVKDASRAQAATDRLEFVTAIQAILESPRFKAYSALDVCRILLQDLREKADKDEG
jgi:hypothetical protein